MSAEEILEEIRSGRYLLSPEEARRARQQVRQEQTGTDANSANGGAGHARTSIPAGANVAVAVRLWAHAGNRRRGASAPLQAPAGGGSGPMMRSPRRCGVYPVGADLSGTHCWSGL
jgi:hypothetical protein